MTATTVSLALGLLLATGAAGAAPLVTAYDDDGMVTVNGKRTLIIGSYYQAKSDRPFGEMADAGFNLIRTGLNTEEMDKAQAAGLMTWTTVGTIELDKKEATSAALVKKVDSVKGHPALAILESVDEPAWTWKKAEARIPPEPFVQAYPIIKAADPNHLLYMNQAPTNLVKTMRAYNGGTDIVACDIYPVNPGGLKEMFALFEDGHQGDLNNTTLSQVGDYVDKMRKVTGPDRPLLMVLQGFAWEMLVPEEQRRDEKILYPSYAESRFMAFQALIKGANGIVYWGSGYTPQPSDFWTNLKRVTREVADLSGPLAERRTDLKLTVDYHEMGHSVDDGVQFLAKAYGEKLYLFTCNADRYRCKATLAGLDGWKTCKVVNEDRVVSIEKGAITDDWKRFDVHIYELSR